MMAYGRQLNNSVPWELHLGYHNLSQLKDPKYRFGDRPGVHDADLTAHGGADSLGEGVGIQ